MRMIEGQITDVQSYNNYESKQKKEDETNKTTFKRLHHRKTNVFLAFLALLLLTHVSKSNAIFIASNVIIEVDGDDVTTSDYASLNATDSSQWNTTSSTLTNVELERCNSRLREMEKEMRYKVLRLKVRDMAIELCARNIQNGTLDLARARFDEVFDVKDADILNIVNLAYNRSASNMENILNFIRDKIPGNYDLPAYSALFEAMNQNGDLSDYSKLLIFNHYILRNPQKYATVKAKLDPLVDSIFTSLVEAVQNGSYPTFTDISDKNVQVFDKFLPELVKKTYNSKLENALNIISFIQHLNVSSLEATANLALFEEMKTNGHLDSSEMVHLASHVKDNSRHFSSANSKIEAIRKELPESVRQLLFETDVIVVMQSQKHVGYRLCGDEDNNLYTYKYEGYNAREVWVVTVKMEDSKCFFSFKNLKHNKQLCSSNSMPHYMGMRNDPEDPALALWEVTPVQNGTYVYLKNKGNGRVLGANDNVVNYSNKCCRSEVKAYSSYTGSSDQHWKIS